MPKLKATLTEAELAAMASRFRTALDKAGLRQSEFARMLATYRPDVSVDTHARRVRTWANGTSAVFAEAFMALDLLAKAR